MAEGADAPLVFEVGPVELDFAVDVRADASADAGVRVWVLSFGAKGGVAAGMTHRMKVVLNAKTRDGGSARIRDTAPAIPPR
jgi:hypothetical protein